MFDIGFLELVLLSVVSLVVLGPERLPGAIRTVTLWVGRLRRSFNSIKQDIEKEIGADEIRRQLRNEAIMDKFKQTRTQVNDTINSVKKETEAFRKNVELEAQTAAHTSNDSSKAKITGDQQQTAAVTDAPPNPAASADPAPEPAAASPTPATADLPPYKAEP